jgi:hypothetical protein
MELLENHHAQSRLIVLPARRHRVGPPPFNSSTAVCQLNLTARRYDLYPVGCTAKMAFIGVHLDFAGAASDGKCSLANPGGGFAFWTSPACAAESGHSG